MKRLLSVIFLLVLTIVYLPLLLHSSTAGDTTYIFKPMFRDFSTLPYAWRWNVNNGLGGFNSPFTSSQLLTIFISLLGNHSSFPWEIIQRIVFVIPFIFLSFVGSVLLGKKIIQQKGSGWCATVIFMTNTYILMLLSGGQYVVALAYALIPLFIYLFLRYLESLTWKYTLFFSLVFGLEVMLDLRFAYMANVILALLFLYFFSVEFQLLKRKWFSVIISLVFIAFAVLLMQMFWVLPTVLNRENTLAQLGNAYTTGQAVSYFSFAKFENSISLLHPNWPENIFGKVWFMKPEFLLLPILAFASLLFITKKQKIPQEHSLLRSSADSKEQKYILYFALLGLLGAFLAKGANDPFGDIYLWMFDHVPGFILFRDPTKWYTLVAVSYAVLIPFSISHTYGWLKSQDKFSIFNFQFSLKSKYFNFQNIFLLIAVCSLLFTIRPALLGQLNGTFKPTTVPPEYQKLEQLLSSQDQFSRTLWVPTTQRFGYSSSLHPAIPARDYFNAYDNKKLLEILSQRKTKQFLQQAGVKYIVVPYDSQKEIFLKDRKYDVMSYHYVLQQVAALPGVKKVQGFGQIGVFELPSPKNHFWSPDGATVSSIQLDPTRYQVHVQHAVKGERVVFAESFDPRWEATLVSSSTYQVGSMKYDNMFNSFVLPKDGSYTFDVLYTPQKWVNIGLLISLLTAVSLLVLGGYLYVKNKTASS